jgi:adenosylhomocysteine nucleosidase
MSDPQVTGPAAPGALCVLLDRAFDHRGYVTLSRRDGVKLVGFVYDRGPEHVELFDEAARCRIRLAVDQITGVEFTGEDSAVKAHQAWERRKGTLEPADTAVWGEWGEPEPGDRGDRDECGDRPAARGPRPVLILVALPAELRSVASVLGARPGGGGVRGRLGAVGAVGLAVGVGGGAAHAVAAERPGLVISCGFAGALDPSLAPGDLVLASSVHDEAGESIAASEPVLCAARRALDGGDPACLAEGELLCTTEVVTSAEAKRALVRPGRLAVDLESAPAAHAARRAGVAWLALRVVLDPLDTDLPAFAQVVRSSYLAPALRHVLRGPRAAAELVELARRVRTASRSLARALGRLGPVIGGLANAEPAP